MKKRYKKVSGVDTKRLRQLKEKMEVTGWLSEKEGIELELLTALIYGDPDFQQEDAVVKDELLGGKL